MLMSFAGFHGGLRAELRRVSRSVQCQVIFCSIVFPKALISATLYLVKELEHLKYLMGVLLSIRLQKREKTAMDSVLRMMKNLPHAEPRRMCNPKIERLMRVLSV
eukprot:TRINITY_DN73848_c0_g1_i1.p2 TRINITY_DN73848_c0_g1~~TRINITY_DN73848_c0_g1_i1.p2  ORF type:complete len:105 (+),score=5.91 TRINITY_DN73848_c0_g1_i1:639-953(+)